VYREARAPSPCGRVVPHSCLGTAAPQRPTAPAGFGESVPVRSPGSRVHSGTSPDGQGREPWRTGQQNLLYVATSYDQTKGLPVGQPREWSCEPVVDLPVRCTQTGDLPGPDPASA